jgi:hypothetical protein
VLDGRPGVVGHGGGSIGVAALLCMVPEQGVAVAILANGGAAGPLFDGILDPLLRDLAGIEPGPELPAPGAGVSPSDPRRYLGRYQTRRAAYDVMLGHDGQLCLTAAERNEALTMAEAAGVPAEPGQYELRQTDGDTFVVTDSSGGAVQACQFLGDDGRTARFLYIFHRAAPRVA